MYPTFYYGYVKKGETLEEAYERDRPRIYVDGFGYVTQPTLQIVDTGKMSRIEALQFLHSAAITFMPAKAVPLEDNNGNVDWMWGVWLAGPDDMFVDGTEQPVWSERMIENARKDAEMARPSNRDDHVIFLRL